MNSKALYFASRLTSHATVASRIVEHNWKESHWKNTFDDQTKPDKYYSAFPVNKDFHDLVHDIRLYHHAVVEIKVEVGEKLRTLIKNKTIGITDQDEVLDITLNLINRSRAFLDVCNDTAKTSLKAARNILNNEANAGEMIELFQLVIDEVEVGSIAYNFKTNSYIHDVDDIDYDNCILTKDIMISLINIREHQDFIDLIYSV